MFSKMKKLVALLFELAREKPAAGRPQYRFRGPHYYRPPGW
jgi:hypothetical protein